MSSTPKYENPFEGLSWNVEPHVCRHCFGRILSYSEDPSLVRCSNCSASDDTGVKSLCACGAMDAGAPVQLRCAFNAHQSTDCPAEFVAVEAAPDRGVKAGPVPARPSRAGMAGVE